MTQLMWFTRDLRLHDNHALLSAASGDMLLCVYVVDPGWFRTGGFQSKAMGTHRWRFLWQSLTALERDLKRLGQRLHIAWGDPALVLARLCHDYGVSSVVRSRLVGTEEQRAWSALQQSLPRVRFEEIENTSMLDQADLPFALSDLPDTFSAFRRQVEKAGLRSREPVAEPDSLPPPPGVADDDRGQCPPVEQASGPGVEGGSAPAMARVAHFLFDTDAIARYKETRNALDDADASSRLGYWLANGSLSVRWLTAQLTEYEHSHVRNESTYWLWFELLWREYFHWYGLKHGARLFYRRGIEGRRQPNTFYPHRFRAWCDGNTEWPLVNAAMNQLRETGYLSNRSRQIVASCLINELGMDWRYGAAWFQEWLVDYDVASNWGNWQYIAGVGADAKGGRHFNLDKQRQQFDPHGDFVRRWRGETTQAVGLHTVDAADWPIMPDD